MSDRIHTWSAISAAIAVSALLAATSSPAPTRWSREAVGLTTAQVDKTQPLRTGTRKGKRRQRNEEDATADDADGDVSDRVGRPRCPPGETPVPSRGRGPQGGCM